MSNSGDLALMMGLSAKNSAFGAGASDIRCRSGLSAVLLRLFIFLASFFAPATTYAMPDELYQGMVRFNLDSGKHFNALVLMDEGYQQLDPIGYAGALQGFKLTQNVDALLEKSTQQAGDLDEADWFRIGKIYYAQGQCIPALKAFKRLKNKLGLADKQEWAFYRSNCFNKLGSNSRSAQVLSSDILSGLWISHAYYNLAMSYATSSADKTKALVALRVASSLNENESREEKALNDRINYAAGALYLNEKKPDYALEFFKKVHLDSTTAPQALYMNGVAHLEQNDFRAATQSWFSVKKYPLIHSGVAESLLAIPYAYERAGYVSQALEAYVEASTSFEKELETVDKLKVLINKHGIQKVLIDETELEGLEWFLAKDIAKNTRRAAYYSYFAGDDDIYEMIELLLEMRALDEGLAFWSGQLKVFEKALSNKQQSFNRRSKSFDRKTIEREIEGFKKRFASISAKPAYNEKLAAELYFDRVPASLEALQKRFVALEGKIGKGKGRIKSQLKELHALDKKIGAKKKRLAAFIKKLDEGLKVLVLAKLEQLRNHMLANFERSEQGLIHILEGVAESSQRKRNPLDGRYQ